MEATHFLKRQIGAGRVCWIGDEHDLGARCNTSKDSIDIDAFVLFPDGYRCCACAQRLDLIDRKAMFSDDRFIARCQIGLTDEAE